MPPRGLPPGANIDQLKSGARSFQRAVRAGDAGAAEVVREFHPRLSHAQPGSPELDAFKLSDALLVVARRFGFPSWAKLKAWLELAAEYARSPAQEPVGGPIDSDSQLQDEFLKLACLNYGEDDPKRWQDAREMLGANPRLSRLSIYTAAASGDVDALRGELATDAPLVNAEGGPHQWAPLLYLTYSRVNSATALEAARVLLDHGADPNAGYLWEGLSPPFTALTGAFGRGEGDPPAHQDGHALARLLLERGADPNDSQTLYNRHWDDDDGWMELLFEFGLGTGDGGPWKKRLSDQLATPRQMLEDALIGAARQGFPNQVRLLLAHGADPNGIGTGHNYYGQRTTLQEAALWGHLEIVALLQNAGAKPPLTELEQFIAAATAGDRDAVDRAMEADPTILDRAREQRPEQLARAAEDNNIKGIAMLIELGFDLEAVSRGRPLHEAAGHGNLEMIKLLLDAGADPTAEDPTYHSTPAGWAAEFGHREAEEYLRALEKT